MKNTIKKMMIISTITLCMAGNVFAGETVSIAISCTIPAIPGVNAPIDKETKNMQNKDNAAEYQEGPELSQETKNNLATESNAKKNNKPSPFLLSEEKTAFQVVKTIYGR